MILERVRDALRAGHQMAGMPPVTASYGVVDAEDGELLDELFRRADALLFEAKHAGRDRIRVAGVTERAVGVFELETVELRQLSARVAARRQQSTRRLSSSSRSASASRSSLPDAASVESIQSR